VLLIGTKTVTLDDTLFQNTLIFWSPPWKCELLWHCTVSLRQHSSFVSYW